jgi:hypothetical protein
MRAILFTLGISFVLTAACAHTSAGSHVNVAAVRHDILDTIKSDGSAPQRTIVSMGHVTADSAVVYTQEKPGAPKHEEMWARDTSGWKLKDSKDLASSGAAASTAN